MRPRPTCGRIACEIAPPSEHLPGVTHDGESRDRAGGAPRRDARARRREGSNRQQEGTLGTISIHSPKGFGRVRSSIGLDCANEGGPVRTCATHRPTARRQDVCVSAILSLRASLRGVSLSEHSTGFVQGPARGASSLRLGGMLQLVCVGRSAYCFKTARAL